MVFDLSDVSKPLPFQSLQKQATSSPIVARDHAVGSRSGGKGSPPHSAPASDRDSRDPKVLAQEKAGHGQSKTASVDRLEQHPESQLWGLWI